MAPVGNERAASGSERRHGEPDGGSGRDHAAPAQAESNVARALHRLQQIRGAPASRGASIRRRYDRALLAYRQAEHESRAARRAWVQARSAAVPAPVPAGAGAPAPPFPRRMSRSSPRPGCASWLAGAQARLSEWDVAD